MTSPSAKDTGSRSAFSRSYSSEGKASSNQLLTCLIGVGDTDIELSSLSGLLKELTAGLTMKVRGVPCGSCRRIITPYVRLSTDRAFFVGTREISVLGYAQKGLALHILYSVTGGQEYVWNS